MSLLKACEADMDLYKPQERYLSKLVEVIVQTESLLAVERHKLDHLSDPSPETEKEINQIRDKLIPFYEELDVRERSYQK